MDAADSAFLSERLHPLFDVLTHLHNASTSPHIQFLRVNATDTTQCSSSYVNASRNLARIISEHVNKQTADPELGKQNADARSLSCADIIALRALGSWADVVLHITHSSSIVSSLSFDVLRIIFDNTLGVFLNGSTVALKSTLAPDSLSSNNTELVRVMLKDTQSDVHDAELHVWPRLERARRHVLQVALSARYGRANLAPKAAIVAGAPLILYISEKQPAKSQVVFSKNVTRQREKDQAVREWTEITMGLCVLEALEVDSASSLRVSVGSIFKDAVWNKGLSPTLIVLHLNPDSTLCDGVGVLRAICDAYGSRLHVEGPATGMFLAGREAESLEHDIALSASSAHSIVMDVGSWLGVPNVAVVSSVRLPRVSDPTHDNSELDPTGLQPAVSGADIIPFWFLLQCSSLQKRAQVLKSACRHMNSIIDALLEYAHMIEYRLVGCGAYLLLSYARNDAPISLKSSLNKAMLVHVNRHPMAKKFHLKIAHYDGMEWLCFSPLLALESDSVLEEIQPEDVMLLNSLLVGAVKRCEVARAGRAAFVASMKQCSDIELVCQEGDSPESAMHFGALRVVPLGLAAGNGHWQRDSEMCEQVEKFTYALGTCLETSVNTRFEGVLQDGATTCEKPFIYIGPLIDVKTETRSGDNLDAAELGVRMPWKLFGSSGVHSGNLGSENGERWNEDAREIAREAAKSVTTLVQTVITNTKVVEAEASNALVEEETENLVDNSSLINHEGPDIHPIDEDDSENGTEMVTERKLDMDEPQLEDPDDDTPYEGVDEHSPMSDPSTDGISSIAPEAVTSVTQEKAHMVSEGLPKVKEKPRPLWSLFFGGAFAQFYSDSGSDSSSVQDEEVLEDDYFRV